MFGSRGLILPLLVVLLGMPGVSRAQIFDTQFSATIMNSNLSSMATYTRNTDQLKIERSRIEDSYSSHGRRPHWSGTRDASLFSVGADLRASVDAKRDFIASIRRTSGDRVADLIAADFDRRDVRAAFREIAGPYGLRSDDYGDVFTAYVIVMWMVANQAPAPTFDVVQAVNAQSHDVLARDGLREGRIERQLAAEGMMYELVAATYGRQEAERVGDVGTLNRMATLARRKFLRSNMDLTDMALGRDGMVRR